MTATLLAVLSTLAILTVKADFQPTKGGDHGRVIRVTTLDDAGEGSLRAAIEAEGPRRVVFAVAGEIWPKSSLVIRSPQITIDGATAPAPGINIMGQRIRIRSHDVIIRHLRFRVGARADGFDPQNRDALAIDGDPEGKDPSYNILVENCSFAWAVDENVQIWGRNNHSIVIRRNIIAEALHRSIHPKGPHSMGLIVGPETRRILIEQNVFAHNAMRNPVVSGGAEVMLVNNLIYGAANNGFHVYPNPNGKPTLVSVIGNLAIASKRSKKSLRSLPHGVNPGTEIYLEGNLGDGVEAFDPSERPARGPVIEPPFVKNPPVRLPGVTAMPVQNLEVHLLRVAGARPDARDAVDQRIVQEIRSRTGQIRHEPTDPRLRAGAEP